MNFVYQKESQETDLLAFRVLQEEYLKNENGERTAENMRGVQVSCYLFIWE